jgi:ElaB/YqjD/DUF883 family membrane-anchored ribosome-binding protein
LAQHLHEISPSERRPIPLEEFAMADIKDRVKGAIDTGADKVRSMTDQAAGAAKDGADRLANGPTTGGPSSFIDKVQDNAESALHAAGDFASHARDRIGDYAGQVGHKVQHWAEDAYDAAGHYAKDFGGEVTGIIRRYPVQALLVGFGVGMLLGRAVRV